MILDSSFIGTSILEKNYLVHQNEKKKESNQKGLF